MSQPKIEMIPLRPAVRSDIPHTLDVLLKITPPPRTETVARPVVNLGLVLDRSGSMQSHNKINFAREAAIFAVEQLLPTDRVSVTIFDDKVQTIVPSTLVENKSLIIDMIRAVHPGGSTALHGGWKEGGKQVGDNRIAGGLNRVVLLSDGMANAGETNADVIATDANRLAREGVSTTTMGLGDDYHEDLLEAMATSGDGSYYYIESPSQLPTIFETELKGLMATFGHKVSLGVEPQNGATVADVLNDFETTHTRRYKLPNLVAGGPIIAVVRLNVPAMAQAGEICRFRLAWTPPKSDARHTLRIGLTLPALDAENWGALAANVEVQERAALLWIARLKKDATRWQEQGDGARAAQCIEQAKHVIAATAATPEMRRETESITLLEEHLAAGEQTKFRKHAKVQAYNRRNSKPEPT